MECLPEYVHVNGVKCFPNIETDEVWTRQNGHGVSLQLKACDSMQATCVGRIRHLITMQWVGCEFLLELGDNSILACII